MPTRFHARSGFLEMHVVVEHPLSRLSSGRISCRPIGLEPIEFKWTAPDNSTVNLDPSGSEASDVRSGRYRIVATDADGNTASVNVDVRVIVPDAVVINAYRTVPASTGSSRDGRIEAIGTNLDCGCSYMWTNGTVTKNPVLHDVPCGMYALIAMPSLDGEPTTLMHCCAPGIVKCAEL